MRRWRWTTLTPIWLAAALVTAACSPAAQPTTTTAPPAATTTTQATGTTDAPEEWQAGDPWDAGAPPEWEQVLAAAREEGSVVVGGFPFLAEPMAAAFERDTGITLDWLGGGGGEISARLEQETRAGNLTIDLILGGGGELETLYPEGLLVPLRDQLILPSVQDGPWWRDGVRQWYDDEETYLLETAGWVFGYVLVNADIIDPASIQTWDDLLTNPEFTGQIISHDPLAIGPGQGGTVGLAKGGLGIEYFVELFETQEVEFTEDNTQVVELVARGTHPIALFSLQSQIERFRAEGFNLEVVRPEPVPGYLTSGFSVIKGGIDPPHPNAAQVFLNWFASPNGQEVYQGVMLEASNRVDIDKSEIPWYVVPEEGRTYFEDSYADFRLNERPQLIAALTEALGGR